VSSVLISLIILVLVAIGVLVFIVIKMRHKESLDHVLLLVRLPRDEDKEGASQKERLLDGINKTEQLFAALSGMEKPVVFEVSVHHGAEDIFFYAAVPRPSVDFLSRQVQGLFPDAVVEETSDYNIFAHQGGSTCAYLALKESYVLPLRTYREAEVDTFAPILSAFSKLSETGEGASLQLVLLPATKHVKSNIVNAIERLQKGEALKKVLKDSITNELVSMVRSKKNKDGEAETKIVDESSIEALREKSARALFYTNVRLVASGETADRAEDILLGLAGAFSQFSAPTRNQLLLVKPRRRKQFFFQYSFREHDSRQAIVLNTAELASIFHLPAASTDVPRIKWLKTREAPPPDNLPRTGIIIGESHFRGERRLVRMTEDDRRRHLYTIGQTGTGKSFSQLSMVVQDMEAGKGLCVIDPHGELVDNILARVPRERADDVIIFNPGDLKRPLGLNMLEYDLSRPEEKSFIVNEIQAIFNKLFEKQPEGLGPMFQQYMRNSLLLLMEDAVNEPATMMEVPRIFTDDAFRNRKLARITNPSVIDFWEKEASKTTGDASLANMAPYITTKFGSFISNDYMRPIIGQTKSAVNFREAMDKEKILLVNLSKGRIGDLNASLLGMVITGKLLMAALGRAEMEEKDRKDFYLYIDEFQNYSTDTIAVILSEARKYRLCLILAHQFISQLTDEIRSAVFGNVGSMMSFRVGVPDTEHLEKEFGPVFTAKDLISQDNGHVIGKFLIGGVPTRPFNMKIPHVGSGSLELRDKIKELSRLAYGRDLQEIEADIFKRLRT